MKTKYNILITDDDNDFRRSTVRLLWLISAVEFAVQEAANGEEALNILNDTPVDCVLLDHRMPGGTGVEWIETFLDAAPHIAIVMVTGQGDEETAVQAMKSGAVDYLVKGTLTTEILQKTVTNAVEKVRMREALQDAERHRVMIESLGTVCHHLGQPMTTVTTFLELMKREALAPTLKNMMDECSGVVEQVDELLNRLQKVCMYRTEPYLPSSDGSPSCVEDAILRI
jgi:FixJ family two-component response regulator